MLDGWVTETVRLSGRMGSFHATEECHLVEGELTENERRWLAWSLGLEGVTAS